MSSLVVRRARRVPLPPAPAAPDGRADGAATVPDDLVDVRVEDGVITSIVPSDAHGSAGPASGVDTVVDADGRWLTPGLWDQHVHLGQWAGLPSRLDLSATRDHREAVATVADAVLAGRPVVGQGMRAGTWARPGTVAELDAVSGAVPVVLVNADFHHAWLNSAALAGLGLPLRDGMVSETEWYAAYARLGRLVPPPTVDDYRVALMAAAAKGVVGLVDLEVGTTASEWVERWHRGCDLIRVRWGVYADGLAGLGPLRTGDPLPGADERLTMGPLKIISDGSLGTRTAWCCEPYADTGSFGAPNQTDDELRELLAQGRARGLEVATHAIGDRALASALAAYEATGARGSIEHAQLVRREDVPRLARLGLRASVQPAHLLDDRDLSERVWPGRGERCFAFRWMLAAGVELAFGSDAPVAPLDPWLAIAAACRRSADEREEWAPSQALTAAEALAVSVDGRRIAVGEPGDLVLLERNPLASTADELRTMPVALTVVGGRLVWGEGT